MENVCRLSKLFKEAENSIQDEERPVSPTMVSTLKMVDSVHTLIIADRRVTIEDISGQISMGSAYKNVPNDQAFSKVSCY